MIHKAVNKKCINALHPDLNGYYREAKITQAKHHWWWKINRIFDQLNETKNYDGLIVFMEEDHYVAPDFIHMLKLMDTTRQSLCPDCRILSMGSSSETATFVEDRKNAKITPWISNLGMAFNRSLWKEIKACANIFCTFDDYNWDWTLLTVSRKCFSSKFTTMVLSASRIFHIGECGLHHDNSCKSKAAIRRAQDLFVSSTNHFFPEQLFLNDRDSKMSFGEIKGNGGWGDVRDHELCLGIVQENS